MTEPNGLFSIQIQITWAYAGATPTRPHGFAGRGGVVADALGGLAIGPVVGRVAEALGGLANGLAVASGAEVLAIGLAAAEPAEVTAGLATGLAGADVVDVTGELGWADVPVVPDASGRAELVQPVTARTTPTTA